MYGTREELRKALAHCRSHKLCGDCAYHEYCNNAEGYGEQPLVADASDEIAVLTSQAALADEYQEYWNTVIETLNSKMASLSLGKRSVLEKVIKFLETGEWEEDKKEPMFGSISPSSLGTWVIEDKPMTVTYTYEDKPVKLTLEDGSWAEAVKSVSKSMKDWSISATDAALATSTLASTAVDTLPF